MFTPKTPLSKSVIDSIERSHEIYENSLSHTCAKIINANDTSEDHPDNETSWREYWENKTGKKLDELLREKDGKYRCPCYKYHEEGDDGYVDMEDICGCHVQEFNENGIVRSSTMYIVPMCRGCNKRKDILKIQKNLLLKLS